MAKAVLKKVPLQTSQDWNPNYARARATEANLAQTQSRPRNESKAAKDSEIESHSHSPLILNKCTENRD